MDIRKKLDKLLRYHESVFYENAAAAAKEFESWTLLGANIAGFFKVADKVCQLKVLFN